MQLRVRIELTVIGFCGAQMYSIQYAKAPKRVHRFTNSSRNPGITGFVLHIFAKSKYPVLRRSFSWYNPENSSTVGPDLIAVFPRKEVECQRGFWPWRKVSDLLKPRRSIAERFEPLIGDLVRTFSVNWQI